MSQPNPGTAAHYANFIFRRRTLSNGQKRGSENYSAAQDGLPDWFGKSFLTSKVWWASMRTCGGRRNMH